ncbi:monovalent cation/H+ antiporter subunit D [Pseudomonas nitroreducens]|uniref:monovalent cation/H+ antiporter subunit D n=1 Tax=Pseudomonas nitroreducens TaxID=46680 RepID=UPI001474F105|nr:MULTISPECIES: monovalent cation/H+ antiporter subunit D [Pseudomonas]MCJ1879842.1 monovalent cation/H+ antiporter subunit D [Pseudomonas nitroreducens]MCJ1895010.1 monovalent cation/H+ antiporter subunit D [Pseudomonas nitroreducens]MDG9857670.1 monovalent cation/H+ antiporter subunit D [Pseudomonas nitroreducens]MDH1076791.1 monovalent cation/H+ antiporter subunit D [Pseudomonas nitroreducens]NMZ72814.1 monovalent cation/H+ antiporter subunit D [Pseudomonas nitroreducens]
MNHWLILPVLLPLFAGCALLLVGERLQRGLSLLATLTLLPLAAVLLQQADSGVVQFYALGNWQPPFGIILVLDRLSALMIAATALLASLSLIYALRGDDKRGKRFHPLFQFQLLGLNGAFLTGDLFNLFVFFEILLIASYALLLHGGGAGRVRAGVHYVVLNLVGSAFFLIAVGTLYGITGTLNMAHMAERVAQLSAEQAPLVRAAALLLLVVFGLKAALLPLYFWLPRAYAEATAPVAALFSIMTKVGIYSILRVYTLIFGEQAGELANLAQAWLWPLALAGIVAGALGALAATTLQAMLSYLVVVSAGTLLAAIALGTPEALSAALYYLLHSIWVAGGLFLLADLIARQRGDKAGRLVQGPALLQPHLLGGAFFFGAIAVAGLPPLSGFLGKLMLLRSVTGGSEAVALWSVVLLSGLVTIVALSRAGSTLFWRTGNTVLGSAEREPVKLLATFGLLASAPLMVVAARPLLTYAQATAAQLLDAGLYRQAILLGGGA